MKSILSRFITFSLFLVITLAGNAQNALLPDDSLRALGIIPLADVKVEYGKTRDLLETNKAVFDHEADTTSTDNEKLEKLLEEGERIKQIARHLLKRSANVNIIQLEYNRLDKYRKDLAKIQKEVDESIETLTDNTAKNQIWIKRWRETEAYYESVGINPTENKIGGIIDELVESEEKLKKELNEELSLQESLINEEQETSLLLSGLADRQNNFLAQLLERNDPFIWVAEDPVLVDSVPSDSVIMREAEMLEVLGLSSWQNQLKMFLQDNSEKASYHLIISLLFLGLLILFRSNITSAQIEEEKLSVIVTLFNAPVVTWALVSIVMMFLIYPVMPFGVRPILLLLAAIPTLILGWRIVHPMFRIPLVIIVVLYNIDQFLEVYNNGQLLFRWLLLLESTAGLAAMFFVFRAKKQDMEGKFFIWKAIIQIAPVLGVLFSISGILHVVGYTFLAQIVSSVIVHSLMVALIILILIRISYGIIYMLLHHSPVAQLQVFQKHNEIVLKRSMQILNVLMLYMWVVTILRKAMLLQPVSIVWNAFYRKEMEYGMLSISVQHIVEFFLVLFGSAVLANIIRALLEEDILIHFSLKRGVPKAIAMMTKYTLMVLGFFLAVSAMGVDVDKLSFLAGGLGVGIGFGLQNIVGNFISGLILIFERPIHQGDVVVAGQTEGEVKEIGLRSCTVRSWDGAEVIVPNQEFITNRVTNWTLSDAQRRKELRIKTDLDANPKEVVERIQELLKNRSDLLHTPAPMVLYQGYSEYAQEFRILFWMNKNLLVATSDIALDIHDLLNEMGIGKPVPIRDIRSQKKPDA